MFILGKYEVMFNVCQYEKINYDLRAVFVIEILYDAEPEVPLKERLGIDTLEAILMNFDVDTITRYEEIVKVLGVSYASLYQTKLKLDL